MTGVAPDPAGGRWDAPFTPPGFARLLRHSYGRAVTEVLAEQADLFRPASAGPAGRAAARPGG